MSAPVSAVSVGSNGFTLTAGGTAVAGTVSASGSVMTFTPAAPLAVSTAYTVTASGFTDLAGNQVHAVHEQLYHGQLGGSRHHAADGESVVRRTQPPTWRWAARWW